MELITQSSSKDCKASKLLRCMEWLQKQNNDVSQKLSVRGKKNDLKYIIQTSADRKKFLLSVGGDDATVPAGAGEPSIKPLNVPVHRLRIDKLRMECEWQNCHCYTSNYETFQKHVQSHVSDIHIIENDCGVEYACLWDVCGHKMPDYNELVRHINYHAYHARLLAIGFNGRATLKLASCRKDSTKRNNLPNLPTDHHCMWTGCDEKFNSMQIFLQHVKLHIVDTQVHLCSWAGCGAKFNKRVALSRHLRSHTNERLIACYHCGMHFASNRKLCDHLRRQNVSADSPYECSMCGTKCATEYLLNEHVRQHVSSCVCTYCDMSAPTAAALANHIRYRHLAPEVARVHACTECSYRAVTKFDLRKHIMTHRKKRKLNSDEDSEDDRSQVNGFDSEGRRIIKKKVVKKYACHLCPEKQMKIFLRGARLTKHLVKEHGAQWPFGHSRFRYQISEDGMYRLTTTRYEVLEVSEKIVDRHSGPKEILNDKSEFKLEQITDPTDRTPRRFAITFKNDEAVEESVPEKQSVEIIMCDVDEYGNVIKSQVMYS